MASKKTDPNHMTESGMENKPDYGYIIFNSILNILFPERSKIGTDLKPTLDNTLCFEDGSFVFNDPHHYLFNILAGRNNDPNEQDCKLNEISNFMRVKEIGTLDILQKRSHILLSPKCLPKSQSVYLNKNGWSFSQILYTGDGIIEEPYRYDRNEQVYTYQGVNKQTGIYERFIEPSFDAMCNPKYPHLSNTSYLDKKKGKSLLKFYCIKCQQHIMVKDLGKRPEDTEVRTFYLTFVKAESTRHGVHATYAKKAAAGKASAIRGIGQGEDMTHCKLIGPGQSYIICKQKKDQWYYYRRENGSTEIYKNPNGMIGKNFGPRRREWLDLLNRFENMDEVYGYSGLNDSVPPIRTGYEFFVPSYITNEIVKLLNPLRIFFCRYIYAAFQLKNVLSGQKAKRKGAENLREKERAVEAAKKDYDVYVENLATHHWQWTKSPISQPFLSPFSPPPPPAIPPSQSVFNNKVRRRLNRLRKVKPEFNKRGGGRRKTRRRKKKKTRKRRKRRRKTRKR